MPGLEGQGQENPTPPINLEIFRTDLQISLGMISICLQNIELMHPRQVVTLAELLDNTSQPYDIDKIRDDFTAILEYRTAIAFREHYTKEAETIIKLKDFEIMKAVVEHQCFIFYNVLKFSLQSNLTDQAFNLG